MEIWVKEKYEEEENKGREWQRKGRKLGFGVKSVSHHLSIYLIIYIRVYNMVTQKPI